MLLERHEVWEIYREGIQTLEDFVRNVIPEMRLRREVSQEVIKSYHVIKQLLVHSYYEYQFVDVAISKLLQTFEMALKIRYKELTREDWPRKKNLEMLSEWFRTHSYFENNDKQYLDQVRIARNALSHPQRHGFAGISWFHWFDTVTDLIKDLYGDVKERKGRLKEMDQLNQHVNINYSLRPWGV